MNEATTRCPSCRSSLPAMATKCDACGLEIKSDAANRMVQVLSDHFQTLEEHLSEEGLSGKALIAELALRKGRFIRDMGVPNNREDLLSLLHYIAPRLNGANPDPNIDEWRAKFHEVVSLAKSTFKNDATARAEVEDLERSAQVNVVGELKNRAKRSPIAAIASVAAILVILAGLAGVEMRKRGVARCEAQFAQDAATEVARLNGMVAKTTSELRSGSYLDAIASASGLHWDLRSDCMQAAVATMASQWDQKRNELEALVRSEQAKLEARQKKVADRVAAEKNAAASEADTAAHEALTDTDF